jgi:nitrite reductase/ring-hydroxylating ferredoxin subunit
MDMPHLHKLGSVTAIKSRSVFTIEGRDIVIVRHDDECFALSNICSHQHISRLHEGIIDCYSIECPMHGWKYDIRSGHSLTGNGTVTVYKVIIDNEALFIEMPDKG